MNENFIFTTPKLAYDVKDSAQMIGVSPSEIERLITEKKLSFVRVGQKSTKRIIPVSVIMKYLEENQEFAG